jgi:membrane dipeptidase
MRRLGRWVAAGLVAAVGFFFLGLPGLVDRSRNQLTPPPIPYVLRPEAAARHAALTIADLHADPLLWARELEVPIDHGHVDLDRLIKGNVAIQVFGSVTKSPRGMNYERNSASSDNILPLVVAQRQPVNTWTSLLERALFHAEKLASAAERSGGRLRVVRTRADLDGVLAERAAGRRVVGGLLGVEGGHTLEGRVDNVDVLADAGFRMIGLAHFFDNEVAGSMHGEEKYGLTPLGREVVARMEARGVLVDVAHLSHQGVAEVLEMARKPVISSHGGVQATCNENRNLSDEEIRGIARTGGLVGVGFFEKAVCDLSPAAIARAIRHVRDLVGIRHVALGSDYDGAVPVSFDVADVALVTQALMDLGFTDEELGLAMGGNAIRVLSEALP